MDRLGLVDHLQGGFGGAAGADVALRMVQAEAAAAAASAAQQLLSRQTPEEPRSWWKLLPKPAVFDHNSVRLRFQRGESGAGVSSST